VAQTQEQWQRTLWHLGNQAFACAPDACAALARALKDVPDWLRVESQVVAQPRYARPGRPPKDAVPDATSWRLQARVVVGPTQVERAVRRKATFLVDTNVLDPSALPDEEAIRIYTRDQGGVERGFAFRKDPLFLASSSVFLKKWLCRQRHLIG
jgi:hypothetical protein